MLPVILLTHGKPLKNIFPSTPTFGMDVLLLQDLSLFEVSCQSGAKIEK